jgi:nucleotide-binding universal stress UspA family protein
MELSITTAYVVPKRAGEEQRANAEEHLEATLGALKNSARQDKLIIESDSIAGGIAKASLDYDMVVIGAAKEPLFRKVLFGEIPEKVARYSPSTVMVVKKYEGAVKSILKRIFG